MNTHYAGLVTRPLLCSALLVCAARGLTLAGSEPASDDAFAGQAATAVKGIQDQAAAMAAKPDMPIGVREMVEEAVERYEADGSPNAGTYYLGEQALPDDPAKAKACFDVSGFFSILVEAEVYVFSRFDEVYLVVRKVGPGQHWGRWQIGSLPRIYQGADGRPLPLGLVELMEVTVFRFSVGWANGARITQPELQGTVSYDLSALYKGRRDFRVVAYVKPDWTRREAVIFAVYPKGQSTATWLKAGYLPIRPDSAHQL